MVGAAAELRRRGRGTKGASGKAPSLFRGHRAGDTGELEPIAAEILDSVPFAIQSDPQGDPEAARYAPRPPRRFRWLSAVLAAFVVVGLIWAGLAVAWSWTQKQYYVGEQDGKVVIYRGLDASLPGLDLSEPYETQQRGPGPALRLRRAPGARGHRRRQPRRGAQHGGEPGRQDDPRRTEADAGTTG